MPNLTIASSSKAIALIYMGGTFGCTGMPLRPLSADQFLPLLQQLSQRHFPNLEHFRGSQSIRDSSELVPKDWQALVEQIQELQQAGYQKIVLIHGTDTLAYTAAFLAQYFVQQTFYAIQFVITGSQYPLLSQDGVTLNPLSDAFINLQTAYQYLNDASQPGCWVTFDQQVWHAQTVQKIHTAALPAFTGVLADNFLVKATTLPKTIQTPIELNQLADLHIASFYLLPISLEQQASQLLQILQQPQLNAIILMAFGMGNLAQSLVMEQALQWAYQHNILVILGTQVPFGGVHTQYATGHWLANFGVLSGGNLTVPAIYARLALLFCQDLNFVSRRHYWQQALTP